MTFGTSVCYDGAVRMWLGGRKTAVYLFGLIFTPNLALLMQMERVRKVMVLSFFTSINKRLQWTTEPC